MGVPTIPLVEHLKIRGIPPPQRKSKRVHLEDMDLEALESPHPATWPLGLQTLSRPGATLADRVILWTRVTLVFPAFATGKQLEGWQLGDLVHGCLHERSSFHRWSVVKQRECCISNEKDVQKASLPVQRSCTFVWRIFQPPAGASKGELILNLNSQQAII